MIASDSVGLAGLLNKFAAVAAAERRGLHARPKAVQRRARLLRVRCEGCGKRVAAVWRTRVGRLVTPYGHTLVYKLPARDAVAPDLPEMLVDHPKAAPELATAVFGYLREYVTGGAVPTEDQYAAFLANLGGLVVAQPMTARCICSGPALHQMDVAQMLGAVGTAPGIGVSYVTVA